MVDLLPFGFSNGHERRHKEYIRDENGEAGPIYVLIESSVPEEIQPPPKLNVFQYNWKPGQGARPRSLMVQMQNIMDRWMNGNLESLDNLERIWAMDMDTIRFLVEQLPSGP
jgi:hypothetical protein